MKNLTEREFEKAADSKYGRTLVDQIVTASKNRFLKVLRILGTSTDDEIISAGEFHHRAFMKEDRHQRD